MTLLHYHEAKLWAIVRLVHVNRGAVVVSFSSGDLSGLVHGLVRGKGPTPSISPWAVLSLIRLKTLISHGSKLISSWYNYAGQMCTLICLVTGTWSVQRALIHHRQQHRWLVGLRQLGVNLTLQGTAMLMVLSYIHLLVIRIYYCICDQV